jgi:hypothetical protein
VPISISWLDEPFILCHTYVGDVSAQEIDDALQAGLGAVEHNPVHFLIDIRASSSIPGSVIRLPGAAQLVKHPNTGWFVIVGTSSLVKFFLQVFVRNRFKVVDTLDEAAAFLQERVRLEEPLHIKRH